MKRELLKRFADLDFAEHELLQRCVILEADAIVERLLAAMYEDPGELLRLLRNVSPIFLERHGALVRFASDEIRALAASSITLEHPLRSFPILRLETLVRSTMRDDELLLNLAERAGDVTRIFTYAVRIAEESYRLRRWDIAVTHFARALVAGWPAPVNCVRFFGNMPPHCVPSAITKWPSAS